MKVETREATKWKPDLTPRFHYWIVGHPKRGYCKAICKYCGERRNFKAIVYRQ